MKRDMFGLRVAAASVLGLCLLAALGCPEQARESTRDEKAAAAHRRDADPDVATRETAGATRQAAAEDTDAPPPDSGAQADSGAVPTDSPADDAVRGETNDPANPATNAGPAQLEPAPPAGAGGNANVSDPQTSGSRQTGSTGESSGESSKAAADKTPYREPLFEGWTKPDVALVVTGRQHGYVEPCGCTGLANQRGGLARRYTLLQRLRDRGWPVLPLDAGNQVRRFGRQAEIKYQTTMEGLRQMQYKAIGLGPDDLRLPTTVLVGFTVGNAGETSPFVCANAAFFGDPSLTPAFQVLEVGGRRIGVTAVIGESSRQLVNNPDVEFTPAAEALAAVWEKLQAADCRTYVLMVQGTLDESRELARKFPKFNLIVSAGGAGEPTLKPEAVEGSAAEMIQVGTKGMYAGVVGLYGSGGMRYQRVPLDARFEDPPQMLELLATYQNTLKNLGLEGLGIQAKPHPSGNRFVGSQTCADCHDREFEIWESGREGEGGPHHHATESLVHPGERTNVPRHFDPECLSCHVTGWNPQKYYPYESGYLSLEATPNMVANGCENCHGPGSRHVAAENGDIEADDALLTMLREQMRLKLSDAEASCMQCHDLDNSPDFHVKGAFERYWDRIRH